jgi:hypothetical protein
MSETRPLTSRLAMPLFIGLVALLIALGVAAAWVPTISCAVCSGSGGIRVETPNFIEGNRLYHMTFFGDQFRVDPCGECRGKGRVTWVHSKLMGLVEQQPIANH